MLVSPAKALFMDEISTGLDSYTTYQIVKYMRQIIHVMDETMNISLLQPAPEMFDLFDDIILISEGQIIYQGPRENVLEFFEFMGFKCPERKGAADFLQEVTSKKDQEQYWFNKNQSYRYITLAEFAESFNSFYIGERLAEELRTPYDKTRTHPAALVKEKYCIINWELFKASFVYFTSYGMMMVALTPGYQIAATCMAFFLSIWNLFSGFLIPRLEIPIWWRWYYWVSLVSWTIYGLVVSQVGDRENLLSIPGEADTSVREYLKDFLGYDRDFLPAVAAAHIGFVFIFFFVFSYGIKYLNFQKR